MPPDLHRVCSRRGHDLVPQYLGERDYPWLQALLDELERHAGATRRRFRERLVQPLPVRAPRGKLAWACAVLDGMVYAATASAAAPRTVRQLLFQAATAMPRDAALEHVARLLQIVPRAVEEALFADLPDERRVVPPRPRLAPADLALQTNSAIVSTLLKRTQRVRVELEGELAPVVRHAKLTGLVCSVRRGRSPEHALLELSGPLALFRNTLVYGRALVSLLPALLQCDRFELRADCRLSRDGPLVALLVRSDDPIACQGVPAAAEIEARFERDFQRVASDWQLVSQPAPLDTPGALLFPDFELRQRSDPARRYFVEVLRCWTPESVQHRIGLFENLILCVDAARNCAADELPRHPRVIRYRRRIDPVSLLRIMNPR